MSQTRLIYDPCYCNLSTSDSVSPMDYQLYKGKFENCHRCTTNDGVVNNIDYAKRVALENSLMNINRNASLCPADKFSPKTGNKGIAINPPDVCDIVPNHKKACDLVKKSCETTNPGKGYCNNQPNFCCENN